MTTVAVLGSTGSVGRQALEVVRDMGEGFQVVALASSGGQLELLAQQARAHRVPLVAIARGERAETLRQLLPATCRVAPGEAGLREVAVSADVALCAISGSAGLEPTFAAARAGKRLALANKESLVAAGPLLVGTCREAGALLLPVDSEHSAIFQCLHGESGPPRRLLLTGSGGPFRDLPASELARATVPAALSHPTWNMGPKITVDSATLVNKGLEVIEAHHLFGVAYDAIEVYVHRQSLVHSLVELADGALLAQLGAPDMRGAIAYALSYPRRLSLPLPRLDLLAAGPLTFEAPRWADFPGLGLGYAAGRAGGTLPAVYSAANEAAVYRFLEGGIGFGDIPWIIQRVMEEHSVEPVESLEHVLAVSAWARQRAAAVGPAKVGGT